MGHTTRNIAVLTRALKGTLPETDEQSLQIQLTQNYNQDFLHTSAVTLQLISMEGEDVFSLVWSRANQSVTLYSLKCVRMCYIHPVLQAQHFGPGCEF